MNASSFQLLLARYVFTTTTKSNSATCSVQNNGPDSAPTGSLRSEIIPQTGLRILKSLSSTILNPLYNLLSVSIRCQAITGHLLLDQRLGEAQSFQSTRTQKLTGGRHLLRCANTGTILTSGD